MRETTQHLLVIIWHVLDDVCLGGELYELPAVWRNETLTELVGIPAVVFRLVQEILLLFHRAQLGHLLLNPPSLVHNFLVSLRGEFSKLKVLPSLVINSDPLVYPGTKIDSPGWTAESSFPSFLQSSPVPRCRPKDGIFQPGVINLQK